jgi:putative DNA primase/helicase
MATHDTSSESANAGTENAIRVRARRRVNAQEQATSGERKDSSRRAREPAIQERSAIPEAVRKRFVQSGKKYFFPDGAPAFVDRGSKLTTQSENTELIRSLVSIAEARGWREITVHGTERFRKEAWFAATAAGIRARGYTPTEFEQARLVRHLGERSAEAFPREAAERSSDKRPAKVPSQRDEAERHAAPRVRPGALITGRLIDHGPARYRHDSQQSESYFVRLEVAGQEREIWGVDLERALRESLTRPASGDMIGLRAVGRERVTIRAAAGESEQNEKTAHRNRWIVEQRDFFASRARAARTFRDAKIEPREAVQRYPELAGSYLQLRAAELTTQRMRDAEDQRRFLAMVRGALADSIARGEPLAPVRLREPTAIRAAATPKRAQERDLAPVRN